jgi:hypothetical protein
MSVIQTVTVRYSCGGEELSVVWSVAERTLAVYRNEPFALLATARVRKRANHSDLLYSYLTNVEFITAPDSVVNKAKDVLIAFDSGMPQLRLWAGYPRNYAGGGS